jgi:hypothetical protein
LSDAEIADLLAYMLSSSDMPAGSASLPTDREALAAIRIVPQSP